MNAPGEKMGASSEITVRQMAAADITAAQSILKQSPQASMWSQETLLEIAIQRDALVAELDGSIAGILFGRVAADEYEILNLAVAQSFRRRGVATRLLWAALDNAYSEGARQFYLEVRASNEGAIAFYSQLGFHVCGRRTDYYSDPVEDAVLLNFHK